VKSPAIERKNENSSHIQLHGLGRRLTCRSSVLENDKGAMVQNGQLFLTRKEALDITKQGFANLQKVAYKFDQQQVTLLSPTVALAVGEGASSVMTADGREVTRPFVQSVVLVLTNSEWKVFHSHRSVPQTR